MYFVDRSRTINFWSGGAERLTGYSAAEVLGRRCRDAILNHVDEAGAELCGQSCPLQATLRDGRPREAHVFMHHRSGHRQPVWVRSAPLRDPDGTIIGAVEVFCDDSAVVAARTQVGELERLALSAPLTGVGNRRYLDVQLAARLDEWTRYGWPFGVLFADIDRFKRINDAHGHDVGDETLRMVATTLGFGARASDTVGRYGGEEFVVLLPHADRRTLADTAERLRALVASSRLVVQRRRVDVTISIGGTLVAPGDSAEAILRRADAQLYAAKEAGRNSVRLDSAEDGTH